MIFIQYPKCSTCQKANKFLKEKNINFINRNIIDETPTKEELLEWIYKSNLELKKFFNTSGKVYKEMNLKDKVKDMSIEEAAELLSSNGMLIKRPLLITEDKIVLGFKEDVYSEIIKSINS